MAQTVKNLPAMQEIWARSLSGEDPLKEEMATYSSILAWRIPWTEEPGRLQFMGSQSQTRLHTHRDYTESEGMDKDIPCKWKLKESWGSLFKTK